MVSSLIYLHFWLLTRTLGERPIFCQWKHQLEGAPPFFSKPDRKAMMTQVATWRGQSSPLAAAQSMRFEALDSWRGICALLVAAFHFPLAGAISQNALVRGSFLFVDFFFVLSGFVFAHAYGARLAKGQGLGRFLITRFGRLVPLHLFMLLVLFMMELARWQIPQLGNGQGIFAGRNTLNALLANILLIHSFGVLDHLTWNSPSWSISAELFAYILFGCILVGAGRRNGWVAGAIFIICALFFCFFSPNFMDVTYDFGLIRCLYGFSFGMLVHIVFLKTRMFTSSRFLSASLWTLLEAGIIFSIVIFVSYHGSDIFSILAPVIFGITVIIFAQQNGLISSLLQAKPFRYIGAISYSIYLTHLMVQGSIYAVARYGHRRFGWHELTKLEIEGSRDFVFSDAENLVLVCIMLVLTVLASSLTYRYIEQPSREWFRRYAAKTHINL
jgi:peptidoglycan/LPS O-acetylase OafA/YrhL